MTYTGAINRAIDRFQNNLSTTQIQGISEIRFAISVPVDIDVYRLMIISALEFEFAGGRAEIPLLGEVKFPKSKFSGTSVNEVYISENGVKLLELSQTVKPEGITNFIIFLEVNNQRDRISPPVFEIVARSGKNLSAFFSETANIRPVLVDILNSSDREYRELVSSRFEKSGSIVVEIEAYLIDKTNQGIDFLIKQIASLMQLIENYKMPRELWNSAERPEDFNQTLNQISSSIDQTIENLLSFLEEKLPSIDISSLLDEIPLRDNLPDWVAALLNSVEKITQRVQAKINGILELVRQIAVFIRANKPDTIDSFDTLIGFISGLWDGIIDLITGVFGLINMALELLNILLASSKDYRLTLQLILEATDQLLQAIDRIDWSEFWQHFQEQTLPMLKQLIEETADDLVNDIATNSGLAGYYFGYLVYNIIEIFFPPLKLTKLSKVGSTPSQVARYFDKIFN